MAISDNAHDVRIIDIRRDQIEMSLRKDILTGLGAEHGKQKTMPTLLLYDEKGLNIFEDITYLDDYYLTNAEIEVLKTHANTIVERVPENARIVELGSGNLRKVSILLKAFEQARKGVEYYALDLSLIELQRTLYPVSANNYSYVKCYGLHGTYDDALVWLMKPENRLKPTCVMSLGSSIGNFNREEAASFLSGFAQTMGPSNSMLVGLDACQCSEKVFRAYNDKQGLTHEFYRNGLSRANTILGFEAFKQNDWRIIGKFDETAGCHQAFYAPIKDISFEGVSVKKGQLVLLEEAFKYSAAQSEVLWHSAGLIQTATFGTKTDDYHIHMLSSPKFSWPLKPEQYAAKPVPSKDEYESLWASWDTISKGMVPHDELLSKPINLRNALIFYLGHIPTFLDNHITRATEGKFTEPSYYQSLFERGIDPDVDNPELCHAHSDIPEEWPPVAEILDFQERVRSRVRTLFSSGAVEGDRKLGRALWIGFEHEVMHLETFLYMLLQSEKTLPPPGTVTPDFKSMATRAETEAVPNEWITVPASKVTLGMDDQENDLGPDRYFGWDIERPSRDVEVSAFISQARPITNGEFASYLEHNHLKDIPASWSMSIQNGSLTNGYEHSNGHVKPAENNIQDRSITDVSASASYIDGKSVRTVFGLVPLAYALDWPVIASYDELAGYATWMNGRIPTLEEVSSIYNFVNEARSKEAENVLARTISAVNGHLSNEGVEETPPQQADCNGFSNGEHSPNPRQLFIDLEGSNVGLKHWHPIPVTQNGNKLSGHGELGGIWEWTSSTLEKHEGYKPMDLYPAYTADFFDGKHNIVLGGSWATHPRIAGRKSFVNWYQRNYPYAWAGARLVRDI